VISAAPSLLSVDIERTDSQAVVRLRGEFDIATEDEVANALDRATASGDPVVVDLRELEFIDVVATHALVEARRRCAERGSRFFLVKGPANVWRVLSLCGVDGEFDTLAAPEDLAHL
jgi:anti-anti-sigma factor